MSRNEFIPPCSFQPAEFLPRASRDPIPTADQPGTLSEQMDCIVYWLELSADLRKQDPTGTWQMARAAVMAHAREGKR